MAKRRTIAVLILVTVFSVSSYTHSGTNDAAPDVCENISKWLEVGSSLELIVLLCSITEGYAPVPLEFNDASRQQDEAAITQSDLPEKIKQHLLLLLAVWGME